HVEHGATAWPSAVHKVDPLARQIGKSREVLGCRKPLRLEAPHLIRRSRAPLRRFAADNPAHSRIVAQGSASFTSSYPGRRPNSDCRNNPPNACRPFLPLRASARTSPAISVEPSMSFGGHQEAAKLEHQAAVEIQPNSVRSRFTPWVHHGRPARSRVSYI